MNVTLPLGCEFEAIRREGALFYHRCTRCGRVLPSFDPPQRTYYYPCPAGAIHAHATRPRRGRYSIMLRSLLAALWRWTTTGFPRPNRALRMARVEACRLCPLQQRLGPRGAVERCASCGCWLPLKRRMAAERCPAERWPGQRHAGGQGLVMVEGKLHAKPGCGCGGH